MKKYLVALLCLCMTISALSANMPLVNAETNAPSAVTVEANQAVTAPSFSELISEGTWGTKAVRINKDSQNAELYDYNGVAEEVAADMYFQWDEENLYVGMVTSDADLRGSGDYWTGDGIQIRVGKGAERTSFVDVCVTLDADNNPSTAGWNQKDEEGNTLPICEHNLLLSEDGTELHIMMAIPLERLGLSAEAGEIGDGTELNVSLLRISGTQDGPYAGWLAWGAFFAPNHDYHKSLSECNIIVLKADIAANGRVVTANKAVAAPSFDEYISEGSWGTKAVHIDKDAQNAELYDYNGVAEDVAADMYFQWDEENLYVGMVTSDADLRGSGDYWTGDGIQIRVGKGAERTSFVDVCVTLDADNNPSTAGWNQKDEEGNTLPICEHNMLVSEDGTELHIMMAIPLERLGLSAEAGEVGDGTELNVSLLRISGTQDGPYAGWLAWGAFFAPNHDYHKTLADCNIIVLKEDMAASGRVVTANKAVAAPSFDEFISEGSWGTKAVHMDKDSYNAELYDYNGVAEEVAADMYFQWDEENLYVGMVTSDADLRGSGDYWTGDGIQIRVGKGAERTSFVDVCVTLDADNNPSTAGWNQKDEEGNTLPICEHNMLISEDGTELHIMMAIPLERLGLSAEAGEVGDGTELNVSLLRISGTQDGPYAGWLAWGAFFAPNHDYHKTLADCNIIVLKDDVATNGRVVTAEKAAAAPSFDEFINEGSWGKKAVRIDKSSYNAELYNYNGTAEDVAADMYFQWDEENLYVGMVTSDADLRGSGDYWTGDGIQIRVGKGAERTSFVDVCVTLGADNNPSTAGWNQKDEEGNTLPICDHNMLVSEDGTELHMMMAIPMERLGLSAEAGEIGDGTELNVSLLRISGTQDGPYAGWLAWGAFFAPNHDYHKTLADCNIIVLHDPNAKAEEEGDSFVSALTDMAEFSKVPSAAQGMNDGYKLVQTDTATYAVYADWYPVVNGVNFDGGLVSDFSLQKISNGSSTDVGRILRTFKIKKNVEVTDNGKIII